MSKIVDERIEAIKQKVSSEALYLLLLFLLGSMLYKQFINDVAITNYIIELIGFFGTIVYIVVRNLYVGSITPSSSGQTNLVKTGLLYGLIATSIVVVINIKQQSFSMYTILYGLTFFIVGSCSYFFIAKLMNWMGKKRIEQLDGKLDDE